MQQTRTVVTHTLSKFIIEPNRFNLLKIEKRGYLSVIEEDINNNTTTIIDVIFSKDDVIKLRDTINQQLKDWN